MGLPLTEAKHEALVSFQTWQRIQERLDGRVAPPRRQDVSEDFPARGFVVCDDCGTPLTACWSKGEYQKHPYYLCRKRGCASYGKSIRRAVLEGEVEALLRQMTPGDAFFKVATSMFKELWDRKAARVAEEKKALNAKLLQLGKEADGFLKRIVETSSPAVVKAYEERIAELEGQKVACRERIAELSHPKRDFNSTLRTSLAFLSSPWNLWASGRVEDRQAVMKLAFVERLRYKRGEGVRTAKMALPFKVLTDFSGDLVEMARLDSETSNELFETLERWNDYLEHRKSSDFPVPPCP